MSAPTWGAVEMIQVLDALANNDRERARTAYKRITRDPDILFPAVCGWATAIARTIPATGPGVYSFELQMLDGTNPGPRQLAVGRVIACMGNDDPHTALDVLHALAPLDAMLAGWDIARMAAQVWAEARAQR